MDVLGHKSVPIEIGEIYFWFSFLVHCFKYKRLSTYKRPEQITQFSRDKFNKKSKKKGKFETPPMIAIKQLTLFISNTPPPDQKRTRGRTKSCHTFHVEKLIKRVYKKKSLYSHLDPTEAVSGLCGGCRGSGESHISSRGILPSLSSSPGVDWLRGRAAVK